MWQTAGVSRPADDKLPTTVEAVLLAARPQPEAGLARRVGLRQVLGNVLGVCVEPETIGRYVVESKAGAGGMGVVYRGREPRTGQAVAIKLLAPLAGEERRRFRREAEVLGALADAHVVRYLEHGTTAEDLDFLVMEWLDGSDLRVRLEQGPLSVREALELGQGAARGLAAAHEAGIVHRDLKPGNLFLVGNRTADVRVMDFGLAQMSGGRTRLTATGAVLGTPQFMAPEQLQGGSDFRTDIHGLGATLFAALAGRPPFLGPDLNVLLQAVREAPAPSLAALRPEVGPGLDSLVGRMLAKDGRDRPASMREVAAELDRLAAALERGVAETVPRGPSRPSHGKVSIDRDGTADGELGPGTLFQGQYELAQVLGRGAFGVVYRAIQRSTGQQVAIKLFRTDAWRTPEEAERALRRFERETRLSASLHHPNIVRLIDAGATDEGRPYSVFEFVPGVTFGAYLNERGKLELGDATRLLGQVLDALAAAHQVGVVHRDLKPENLLITRSGVRTHAKVLDFGIGALLDYAASDETVLTEANRFIGTPAYAAPEQLRGEPASAAADLYAWGLLFLEAVTGERVMSGGSFNAILAKQLDPTPLPLPPILEGTRLGALVALTLARDARERAITAAEAVQRLAELEGGGELAHTRSATPAPRSTAERAGVRGQRQLAVAVLELRVDRSPALDLETYEAWLREGRQAAARAAREAGGYVVDDDRASVIACFGTTRSREDDGRRAARAARAMLAALAADGLPGDLRGAGGVHVGLAIAGEGNRAGPRGFALDGALELAHRAPSGAVWVSRSAAAFLDRSHLFEAATELALPGEPPGPCYNLPEGDGSARASGLSGEELLPELGSDVDRAPLLGRDHELEMLRQRWLRALDGQGQAVVLTGEAGIGKSRLASELMREVRTSPTWCLECQCAEEDEGRLLRPIEMLLERELIGSQTAPEHRREALESALGGLGLQGELDYLATLLGVSHETPAVPPEVLRGRMLDAIVRVLLAKAEERPVALLVEDLHWSDPTTIELLGRLIEQLEGSVFLLLCTTRTEYSVPWGPRVLSLPLGRLDPAAARKIALAHHPEGALSDSLVDAIIEWTEGVPFFVEELVEEVVRRGVRRAGSLAELGIPATLRGLLGARLDAVGPALETAQLAAALGVEFEREWLGSLRDPQVVEQDLATLVAADLVRRRLQGGRVIYRFRHALVCEVAYGTMVSSTRRAAHGRIADLLEESFPETARQRPDLLAHHRSAAGQLARAIPHAHVAAQAALVRSANVEAAQHARRGLSWLEAVSDARARDALELDLNAVLAPAIMATAGLWGPELQALLQRSRELLDRVGDSPHGFPTYWMVTLSNAFLRPTEALAPARELLRIAERGGDTGQIAAANALVGASHFYRGELREGHVYGARAVELWDVERHGSFVVTWGFDPYVMALFVETHYSFHRGECEWGLACSEQALDAARRLGVAHSMGSALYIASLSYYTARDRIAVRRLTDELRQLSADHKEDLWVHYGELFRGWADDHLEGARAALEILEAMGAHSFMPFWQGIVSELEMRAGQHEAAQARLEAWMPRIEACGIRVNEPALRHIAAKLRRAVGDEEGALEHLRAAVELGLALETYVHALRAALEHWEIRPGSVEAREALERSLARLVTGTTLPEVARARQLLDSTVEAPP
jgi:TOMM system kinase/cyclase fusion protein